VSALSAQTAGSEAQGRGRTTGNSAEAYAVSPRAIALALGVSWLGLWAHEVYRVPDRAGLTSDGSLPMLGVLVGLLVLGRAFPRQSTLLVGARALGTLHLLGAVLTVLPLGVFPFVPEQTPEHYGAHLVYAVAHVPLLWLVAPRPGRRA
jgi:hypothetical protein